MAQAINNQTPLEFSVNNEQNIFFTSDTHFFHKNIIKYCSRPFTSVEEMNAAIIKNWNSVVRPNDIVFHLGDFGLCSSDNFKTIFEQLNGIIYLVIGNHDWKLIKQGTASQFADIKQQMKIKITDIDKSLYTIYLNHFPFLCFDGTYNLACYKWQLFGHVHSGKAINSGLDIGRLIHLHPSQYDVGVDNNNYTPVSFAQVRDIIKEQILSQKNMR